MMTAYLATGRAAPTSSLSWCGEGSELLRAWTMCCTRGAEAPQERPLTSFAKSGIIW